MTGERAEIGINTVRDTKAQKFPRRAGSKTPGTVRDIARLGRSETV